MRRRGCEPELDAWWEEYVDGIGRPSREKYKGTAPESTKEAQALVNLTKKELFCRTVSYHSSGGVIYWAFGQQGELASRTQTFAKRIAAVTGYEPDGNYEELDPAGYKDWALLKMGIPSLTIEIGRADSPCRSLPTENPPGEQEACGKKSCWIS